MSTNSPPSTLSKVQQLAILARQRQQPSVQDSGKPLTKSEAALFLGTYDDKSYVPYLKGMFNGINTYVLCDKVELLSHLELYCTQRNIKKVVSTNTAILSKLLEKLGNFKAAPKLSEYAGSVFDHAGLEIVFINPLKQLLTVTYGKFITARYISKVCAPKLWAESTQFNWHLLSPSDIEETFEEYKQAYAIAIDIETLKQNLVIRCIGFCAVFITPEGGFRTSSCVLPIDSMWAVAWMRKFCDLPAQKIFQNGKYDCSYLLRYNSPPRNWLWDTAHFMHSWYSELPKDLAFLNAYFLRKVVYWKDLAETNDLHEYYRYNALDTWATANVWIQQMLSAPDWARKNYSLEFPLVYPCLLAEMTGIKRDMHRLEAARTEVDSQIEAALGKLRSLIPPAPNFNPGSSQQVKLLLKILGCVDLDSSDEKSLAKAALRHPINRRIIDVILDYRGLKKLASTYLRLPRDAKQTGIHAGEGGGKEFKGRILYSLNPHGTDTGRLASREHSFWCGLQIQNVPRGKEVKQTLSSDDGFYLGECDLEQAESRDTAHISGDTSLITAVSETRDFHSVNASAFFGVPYESIYDDSTGKTKDKKLRDLAKRVNHGANYNMGPGVLIDTMGLDKIWEAKRLLKLPYSDPKEIASYLLAQFHKTYPAIKGAYYVSVINEIGTTRKLTSRAYHHVEVSKRTEADFGSSETHAAIDAGDWTRYCFGNPDKNKSDLNSYVAHCPQSLNARTLNEAFLKVFYEVALPNPETFRLHAQIHDSILFSYANNEAGYLHPAQVRSCMEIPVTVKDVSGNYRTFTVPAALKIGTKDKPAIYWSETE
jgi:DNA polymerase I-like protein with 3'-5' exonuclease and polymerase domains